MCGIFGIFSRTGVDPNDVRSKKALELLRHRGRDGEGLVVGREFSFAHSRLSLVDLTDAGSQPMWDASGRYCIVYNGEIYNHNALRDGLIKLGYRFRSKTDTEVILNLYSEHGISAINQLVGMFAFAIFDRVERSCLLVRDRLGVKPLFYAWARQELTFSSEPAPLRQAPFQSRVAGADRIAAYLNYRSVLGEDTLWEGIKQLPPGGFLMVRGDALECGRWWQPLASVRSGTSAREWSSLFTSALQRSVVQQSEADVPVGLFLSGGLDSSMIGAVMAENGLVGTKAFTAQVSSEGYDEVPFAEEVSASLGLSLITVPIQAADHVEEIDALTRIKDFPLSLHNELAVAKLAETARCHVKAALSGEGADEIIGGYGRLARIPFEVSKDGSGAVTHQRCVDAFLQAYGYFKESEQLPLWRHEHRKDAENGLSRSETILRETWARHYDKSELTALCATMTEVHLPVLLGMMDSMTMAKNLEVRVPFTDHELVDLVLSAPDRLKIAWRFPGASVIARSRDPQWYSERLDETKRLYRRSFAGRIPGRTLRRKKQGFPVPWSQWLEGGLKAAIDNAFMAGDAPIWDYFDRSRTREWLNRSLAGAGRDDPAKRIWALFALDRWLRLQ